MDNKANSLLARIAVELKKHNRFLCCAESCTGGYLSHLIISIPQSAKHFNGSIVCYSPELKNCLLDVSRNAIKQDEAVNERCAIEMMQGALKRCNSDYAIAITGFAGPDGGTDENPVGTVWIAVGDKNNYLTRRYILGTDRDENISQFSILALQMLVDFLES